MTEYQTIPFARTHISLHSLLLKHLQRSNWLAEQLADKLDIQAESVGEAADFVRQALLDIVEQQCKLVGNTDTGCIDELRNGPTK